MTDPIGDFLNRMKTSSARKLQTVLVPHSRLKGEIADLLVKSGYLSGAEVKGKRVKKFLEVGLVHSKEASRISGLRRISKPGKRVYVGATEIAPVREGKGMKVLSTPKGLLSDKEARKAKVGGEVLFEIW